MLRHVVWYKFTDVSEVLAASFITASPRATVFDNKLLVEGLVNNEVTEEMRKLINEELHNIYHLLNIVRVIK
jgi:hypothetical protein